MMESECQEVWNTWELVSEIKPRGWRNQKKGTGRNVRRGLVSARRRKISGRLARGQVPTKFCGRQRCQEECGALWLQKLYEDNWHVGKKPSISLSLFLEINNLEIEHELACAATCSWARAVRTGKREDDMREAWQWQVLQSLVGQLDDIKQTLICLAKRRSLAKCALKHEIGELKEGARFEPIKALFKRKPNHSWTARHAASKVVCHQRSVDAKIAEIKYV